MTNDNKTEKKNDILVQTFCGYFKSKAPVR